MHGRRTEHFHHTEEQIREAIAFGLAVVAELELDDELRPIAFAKAVELRVAKQIAVEAVMPAGVLLNAPPRV